VYMCVYVCVYMCVYTHARVAVCCSANTPQAVHHCEFASMFV